MADGKTSTTASQKPAGGTLVIWADDQRAAALKPFADKFGKDNGVTVQVQAVSKDLQTNFVTASQSGKGPDIVVGAHDWIGNLVQNGTIDPVQLTDAQKAGFADVAMKAVTFNGQLYGVPYAIENIALIRNTDLAPTAPATLEDLVTAGQALKAAGKVTNIMSLQVGQTGDAYHIYPLFASGGGYLFGQKANGDYDPADLGVDKPASVAAFTEDPGPRREGLRRAHPLDHRRQRDPDLHRWQVRVPDLRAVGDRRHQEGRHQVRHHPGARASPVASPPSRSSACRRSTWPARVRARRWPTSSSPTT